MHLISILLALNAASRPHLLPESGLAGRKIRFLSDVHPADAKGQVDRVRHVLTSSQSRLSWRILPPTCVDIWTTATPLAKMPSTSAISARLSGYWLKVGLTILNLRWWRNWRNRPNSGKRSILKSCEEDSASQNACAVYAIRRNMTVHFTYNIFSQTHCLLDNFCSTR